jgi:hypothetical protein
MHVDEAATVAAAHHGDRTRTRTAASAGSGTAGRVSSSYQLTTLFFVVNNIVSCRVAR